MKEILNYYYIAKKRFDLQLSIIRRNMLVYIYNYLKENNRLYDYNLSITQEELRYLSRRLRDKEINVEILDIIPEY